MKRKPTKIRPNPTAPDEGQTLLDKTLWLLSSLVTVVASLVVLILFRRKQTPAPKDFRVNESEPAPKEIAPDDDPQIFNLRTFRYFTVALVALVGFVLLMGALLSGFYLPGGSLITTPAPTLLPPGPLLESYPAESYPALRATQESQLNSYGWVDREQGTVHIPIERAMELIAQRNLPVVTGTPMSPPPSP